MGEPWEFDDNPVQAPAIAPARRFGWFHDLSDNTRFTIIAWAFLGGLSVCALLFAWAWESWLAPVVMPLWGVLGPILLVALLVAVPIASVALFIRGLFFTTLNTVWLIWGAWFGVAVGVATFAFSWFSAVQSWGWLLGLAFGWIPAAIVAVMAAVLAWSLAPAVLITIAALAVAWAANGWG